MIRVSTAIGIVGAVLTAIVVTGCSDNDGSKPWLGDVVNSAVPSAGQQPDASGAPGRLPYGDAPPVPEPIADTSRWEKKPCHLLTEKEINGVGWRPWRADPTGGGGPGCEYTQMANGTVEITWGTDLPDGLSGLYSDKANFPLFEPIEAIEGHPAVIADTEDRRKTGFCAVWVGLRNDLTFRTIVDADPEAEASEAGKDPCKLAVDFTALAVRKMKDAG